MRWIGLKGGLHAWFSDVVFVKFRLDLLFDEIDDAVEADELEVLSIFAMFEFRLVVRQRLGGEGDTERGADEIGIRERETGLFAAVVVEDVHAGGLQVVIKFLAGGLDFRLVVVEADEMDTGNTVFLMCWAREVLSSIRVSRESWGLPSSHCRAK